MKILQKIVEKSWNFNFHKCLVYFFWDKCVDYTYTFDTASPPNCKIFCMLKVKDSLADTRWLHNRSALKSEYAYISGRCGGMETLQF